MRACVGVCGCVWVMYVRAHVHIHMCNGSLINLWVHMNSVIVHKGWNSGSIDIQHSFITITEILKRRNSSSSVDNLLAGGGEGQR